MNPAGEQVDEAATDDAKVGADVAGSPVPEGRLHDRLHDRLQSLEEELAYQGQTVSALNEALGQQQRDILTLRRQVELLAQEVKLLRQTHNSAAGSVDEDGVDASEERPPHY